MLVHWELISRRCIKPQALEKLITGDVNLDLCAPLSFTIYYNNFRNDDNAVTNINLSYINFLEWADEFKCTHLTVKIWGLKSVQIIGVYKVG